jgi:hypothetical protein
MTKVELESDRRERLARAERLRSPPTAIRILLPVWGEAFLKLFLDNSLPTLLAPSNIPALAAALPCRFILMTRAADLAPFRGHPALQHLQSICPVDVHEIDDLVTGHNHSTTLTLAYERVVIAAGKARRDTCFFFLVSDYIVADGSLAAVLKRMMAGASGVVATNLQTFDYGAGPSLTEIARAARATAPGRGPADRFAGLIDKSRSKGAATSGAQSGGTIPLRRAATGRDPVVALRPRALVSLALARIHPAMIANMVDTSACHNTHTNKLLWRADPQTLIGRYFLMHMICIRPETDDFVISSSCDYSFIPEMCPSGNVDAMTDSDEYLVVEAQSLRHEMEFLSAGPLTPEVLAASLEEWATAEHRGNARHTIIYHAGEIGPATADAIARADDFLARANGLMNPTPVSHRNHPYWRGAIAAHRLATGQELGKEDCKALGRMRPLERSGILSDAFKRYRTWLIGGPLDYRPWHPRWLDYEAAMRRVASLIDPSKRLIVLTRDPYEIAERCFAFGRPTYSPSFDGMMGIDDTHRRINAGKFDVALTIIDETELVDRRFAEDGDFPRRLMVMLKPRAAVLIVILNPRQRRMRRFNDSVAKNIGRLIDVRMPIDTVRYVRTSQLRAAVQNAMTSLCGRAVRHPLVRGPFALIFGPPLALMSLLLNLRHRAGAAAGIAPVRCSSVFVEFRVEGTAEAIEPFRADAGTGG